MNTGLSELPSDPQLALFSVFMAGLLSAFTPGVLPMLPITMATLGISRTTSWLLSVFTSLCYVVGIVLSFSALGVLFAFTGTLFGSLLGHPVTAVALALLFVVLASSCFDILSFTLPAALRQRAERLGSRGPVGAFAAGLVAGIIASPCIGPILAAILSFVATTRNVGYGALLVGSYGLGFGLPFLLAGTFALRMPKDGSWSKAIKGLFGIALLIGAYWFLRSAFPQLTLSADPKHAAVATLLACVGYAVLTIVEYDSKLLKSALVICAAFAGSMTASGSVAWRLDWCEESPDQQCLQRAQSAHERTLLVFGAEWSMAYHQMKLGTLKSDDVRGRLADYGKVMVDADNNEELLEKYCHAGVPSIVVIDRDGKVLGSFSDPKTPPQMLAWLDELEAPKTD